MSSSTPKCAVAVAQETGMIPMRAGVAQLPSVHPGNVGARHINIFEYAGPKASFPDEYRVNKKWFTN